MTLIIGLTGGIGSGKSTVAQLFEKLGVPVFDTDAIAKALTQPDMPALLEIKNEFGDDIVDQYGNLDRKAMKKIVFNNDSARDKLEKILHPKIRATLLAKIATCNAPYCIAVIPLLIEKGWQSIVDRVLAIDLPEATQLARAMSRDGTSRNVIQQIMQAQVDRKTRLSQANETIDNSGDENELVGQVNELHEKYMLLSKDF